MADLHPTPDQLYRARRGPRGAEAERHLAHAAACASCSAELARQDVFDHPEPVSEARLDEAWERFTRTDAAHQPRRRPALARGLPALALAATLAACVIGFTLLGPARTAAPPVDAGVARGGGEVAGSWSPTGPLPEPPTELVFPAQDGELRRVTVYDAAGTYRWTSEPAAGGRVPFPEAERQRLRPGVEYFWTVLDGEGTAAAQSFTIRPPDR